MQASFRNTRRAAWISIPVAAGLIFFSYYYGSRSDSSPAQAAGPARSAAPSISRRTETDEPAPEANRNAAPRATWSEPKLVVNGVIIAPGSKSALISVGDQPARLFAEGERIADGVVLRAVNPDRVVVDRGGELLRIRVRGAASGGSESAALPDAEAVPDEPTAPIPPLGTEERRAYQSQNRD